MSQGRTPPGRNNSASDDEWENDGNWDESPQSRHSRDEDEDDDRGSGGYRRLRRDPRRRRRSSGEDSNTPFVLALLGWFLCGILSIIALVMGINQINSAKNRGDPAPGMAIAAVVISGLHIVLMLGVLALIVLVN